MLQAGCIFGGGNDETPGTVSRPRAIPTATLPANLPEPLMLGEAPGPSGQTTGPAGAAGTYVVKSGDTLFGIAAQLGVPPEQQAAWATEVLRLNNMSDATLLRTGQELRLPATTATTRTATPVPRTATPGTGAGPAATPAVPAGTAAAGAGTYTVVAGDYPLLIAEKLGVPAAQQSAWADQLLVLNNIASSRDLKVGQVLRLPAGTPGQ